MSLLAWCYEKKFVLSRIQFLHGVCRQKKIKVFSVTDSWCRGHQQWLVAQIHKVFVQAIGKTINTRHKQLSSTSSTFCISRITQWERTLGDKVEQSKSLRGKVFMNPCSVFTLSIDQDCLALMGMSIAMITRPTCVISLVFLYQNNSILKSKVPNVMKISPFHNQLKMLWAHSQKAFLR